MNCLLMKKILMKAKFVFYLVETNAIKKWIIYSMGKKWRTWKVSLKARAYDSSLTIDEIVENETQKDGRVNSEQFKTLVTRWFTPEFQRTCEERRKSRKKLEEPHVTGTKSFARLAHEEASLEAFENESTHTLTEKYDFSNDVYSKVKGPEKRGYIRLVGRMPTVKESVASSSTESQSVENLKSDLATTQSELATTKLVVSTLLNLFHEHIPNANLSGVLNNLNIQMSDTSAFLNISLANQRSPGTSGGSS